MNRKHSGFTLLELIIIGIIIAILGVFVIPTYRNAVEKKRGEVCINHMRMIIASWKIFNMTNATNFAETDSMVFYPIHDINDALGTVIEMRDFGELNNPNNPGFEMWYYETGVWQFYHIKTYRSTGPYSDHCIECQHAFSPTPPAGFPVSTYPWAGTWFPGIGSDPPDFPFPEE